MSEHPRHIKKNGWVYIIYRKEIDKLMYANDYKGDQGMTLLLFLLFNKRDHHLFTD